MSSFEDRFKHMMERQGPQAKSKVNEGVPQQPFRDVTDFWTAVSETIGDWSAAGRDWTEYVQPQIAQAKTQFSKAEIQAGWEGATGEGWKVDEIRTLENMLKMPLPIKGGFEGEEGDDGWQEEKDETLEGRAPAGPDNLRNPKIGRYTKGPFPDDPKGQKTPDDYVEPSNEEKFDNLVEIFAESSIKADLTSPSAIEDLIKQLEDIKQNLPDTE